MLYAGLDAGSRTIKVVLLDGGGGEPVVSLVADQGVQQEALARKLFEEALKEAGASRADVARLVATGYGRHAVGFADTAVTEIACHARGARRMVPDAAAVVDIGGQDCKLILLDEQGAVRDFAMNDRCAAGAGRFLEVVADRLGVPLDELGRAAAASRSPVAISSVCVVFAETEIVGLLANHTPPADVAAGVQQAMCKRVASMVGRGVEGTVVFTGGVALVPGVAQALGEALGCQVTVPPSPRLAGALGAALAAADG